MSTSTNRPWFWEGCVQAALADALSQEGWTVRETADTQSKAPGIDLLATRSTRWLAIEVKGYPSATYEHGERRGQPKPTQPTNQARQWFSHALLSVMLLRSKRPDAEIALCFPRFPTYERLIQRTRRSLSDLGIGVYLVNEAGTIDLEVPHEAPAPGSAASGNASDAASPSLTEHAAVRNERRESSWSVAELRQALDEFEAELVAVGLADNTIRTYVDRSRYFVRWLDGDFQPRGPDT